MAELRSFEESPNLSFPGKNGKPNDRKLMLSFKNKATFLDQNFWNKGTSIPIGCSKA